jgi:hypothetical protein
MAGARDSGHLIRSEMMQDLTIATPPSKADNACKGDLGRTSAQLHETIIFRATIGGIANGDRNGRMCRTCGCGHEPAEGPVSRGNAFESTLQQERCPLPPKGLQTDFSEAKNRGREETAECKALCQTGGEAARRKGEVHPKGYPVGITAET